MHEMAALKTAIFKQRLLRQFSSLSTGLFFLHARRHESAWDCVVSVCLKLSLHQFYTEWSTPQQLSTCPTLDKNPNTLDKTKAQDLGHVHT